MALAAGSAFTILLGSVAVAAAPAQATATLLEVGVDAGTLMVTGHPGAASGDILISLESGSYVVRVDPDSGGGAQVWSVDPSCNPATGTDALEVRCAAPPAADAGVVIDLEGIDASAAERTFSVLGSLPAEFYGSAYDDYFQGGSADDYVEGGDGDDSLFGGGGDDEIYGGDGADTIEGEGGADSVEGGAGPDEIDVQNARDPKTHALLDRAIDTVDCNDDESRGTDNSGTPRNVATYDKGADGINDTVTDCGATGAPVNTKRPNILADPVVGVPVSSDLGTWEGKALTYTYKWASCVNDPNPYQDCKDVQSTDDRKGMTYTPKAADEGRLLLFSVTARNNAGELEMTSGFSAPVAKPKGPTNYFPPFFLDNNPIEGKKVAVNVGSWSTEKGSTFAYVIEYCYLLQSGKQKCRTAASGAATPGKQLSFTPTDEQAGTQLRITVTGTAASKATTVVSSLLTGVVDRIGKVTVPESWQPKSIASGYSFTKVATVLAWADVSSKTVPVDVNVVRVGLPAILAQKQYASLRKYRQYLPMNDGAVLAVTPDFGDSISGFPGMSPAVVTVVVYDKLLDLDSCAAVLKSQSWVALAKGDALRDVTGWLTSMNCPDWRVVWSTGTSPDQMSRVEKVEVVSSLNDGVTTSTIVVTANKPKVANLALAVTPASFDAVAAYPEHSTLTMDGDLKAFDAPVYSTLTVLGYEASSGMRFAGGRYASVELFNTDGRRIAMEEFHQKDPSKPGFEIMPLSLSGAFRQPGVARVIIRLQDSSYQWAEAFVDIPVHRATGTFATVDGRCFSATGTPGAACPPPSEFTTALADGLTGLLPEIANADPYAVLRAALAHEDSREGLSNISFAEFVVNGSYLTPGSTPRMSARDDCPWWNLWCKVVTAFTPKPAKAMVKPAPPATPPPVAPPPIPPSPVTGTVRTVEITPTAPVSGIVDEHGCARLGVGVTLGCGGVLNATKLPMSDPNGLINLDGGTLIGLDGGTLIGLDGGTLIGLDGGTLQVSPALALQNAGRLTVPVGILAAGGLN